MLEQFSGAAGKSRQRRVRQLPVTDQRVVNQCALLVSEQCVVFVLTKEENRA